MMKIKIMESIISRIASIFIRIWDKNIWITNVHEIQGSRLRAALVIPYSGKTVKGTAKTLHRAVARNGIY